MSFIGEHPILCAPASLSFLSPDFFSFRALALESGTDDDLAAISKSSPA